MARGRLGEPRAERSRSPRVIPERRRARHQRRWPGRWQLVRPREMRTHPSGGRGATSTSGASVLRRTSSDDVDARAGQHRFGVRYHGHASRRDHWEGGAVELTFDNVTGGGETTVTSQTVGQGGGPPAPPQFRLGSPPTYYNIETSATFAGNVTVCIRYADVSYGTERQLKLQHFTNGRWVDATDPGYPDLANHVICGTVASLSPFLVAQQNFDPTVTAISLPNDPVALGSVASVTAAFADANPSDTHTASVAWQQGVTSSEAVAEKDGVGTVASSHTYTAAGVYAIVVTVNDGLAAASRSSALDVPAYVDVYDPRA